MLNRIVELIKNTNELNHEEKCEGIVTIMGYGDKWTRRNAVKVLGAMEKGKAYRCKDLTPIITGREFEMYDQCCINGFMKRLVTMGAIRREVVVTGREIEIPNPKRTKLKRYYEDLSWCENIIANYVKPGSYYFMSRSEYISMAEEYKQKIADLESLPKTIKVKEKIAYFYKTF
jgi:hypothetical protein